MTGITPEERIARQRARREAAANAARQKDEELKAAARRRKIEDGQKAGRNALVDSERSLRTVGAVALALKLPEEKRNTFLLMYQSERRSATVVWILSFFFGAFGVDRFVIGQPVMGLLKLFTLGMCGVLWFIDLLVIGSEVSKLNNETAYKIYSRLIP